MSVPPENLSIVRQWVEKAEHDLRNAEHTLTMEEDCPFDTVCFHAQQCAEKYLKALLLSQSLDFPKTHDLRVLVQLILSKFSLNLDMAELVKLNRYSIESRYPGDWDPIARLDAEEAVAIAQRVRQIIRNSLNL
jgi:HEPN domain-containing protein